jgi:hypothetical protein
LPLLATLVGIGTLECLTVPILVPYPLQISDSQTVRLNLKWSLRAAQRPRTVIFSKTDL